MAEAAEGIKVALTSFALDGNFPDNVNALPPVSETDLEPTIQALEQRKTELESEIHVINEETRGEVASWEKNSKSLQEDIIRSKTIANNIIRQSEAPDVSGEVVEGIEAKAEFLNREVQYSQQLREILQKIRKVDQFLAQADEARSRRQVLDALRLLESSWKALDEVGVGRSSRVIRLLDSRAYELKSSIHQVFNHVWNTLIQVDVAAHKISIHDQLQEEHMGLSDAAIGLQAYKEVEERMEQLWHNVDGAIIKYRMNPREPPSSIRVIDGTTLCLDGESTPSIDSLLSDLETGLRFLASKLPSPLLGSFSGFLAADLVPRLIQQWLDPAVPSSLQNMHEFQAMIDRSRQFYLVLQELGYAGIEELQQWVEKAPTVWLGKCREIALDSIRSQLAHGIGSPKQVEKIERQMVSVSEGKTLATTGAGAAAESNDWADDWGDDAWADDQDNHRASDQPPGTQQDVQPDSVADDGADAWGWGNEDEDAKDESEEAKGKDTDDGEEEDDSADAWGWGDQDATDAPPEPKSKPISNLKPATENPQEQTRELVLKEIYHISSLPDAVFELIIAVLEDGAALTGDATEYRHVASTAPGLFGLPTLVLALFRAISPYHYSLEVGGNMFLYNDAMYLAEKLSEFSSAWKQREDLTPRAKAMLRLDNDIKSLQSFANRSYGNEMNLQKTVLRDFLGGAQSLMQQDETESSIEAGTTRIRQVAATWEPILARSVLSQAVGSLADALAIKFITDVLEMSSIGQEEAYNIAQLISSATELDDLFLPSKLTGHPPTPDEIPWTSQYAPNWLRLKFLSEVLQSNLNEVKALWLESELSLYFTLQEVIELIRASFADSDRTRETIRSMQANPRPVIA